MIVPLNMLWALKNFADMINQKFGLNVSVHFAGAWLGEMERYETTVVENGEIDIDEYDAVEETNQGEEVSEKKESESEVSENATEDREDT